MKTIQIYDTTLRDGTQGEGISLSLQDKLQIAQRLDEIGVDYIEGGYPLSNEKDVEFFQRIDAMDLKHAQVCAFGMTRRKGMTAADDPGMQALLASKAPVCTVVGKAWAFHVTEVLRVSLDENLAMIADSIRFLVDGGREVIYDAEHCFDGWKQDPQYAAETLRTAADAGAKLIALCDTNGGFSNRKRSPALPARSSKFCNRWISRSASIATTTATWRSPIRWLGSMRGPFKCKERSTALGNGAGMRT